MRGKGKEGGSTSSQAGIATYVVGSSHRVFTGGFGAYAWLSYGKAPHDSTMSPSLHRSAYANVSPRYNQPPAGMLAAQQHQQQQQEPAYYPAYPFRPQINQRSREIAQRLLPVDR